MSSLLNQILKKPVFVILLMIVIFCFSGMIYFGFYTKNSQIKPQSLPFPKFNSEPKIKLKYSYSGQLPSFGEKHVVYQIPIKSDISEEQIMRYRDAFGLNTQYEFVEGADNSVYLFKLDKKSLSISINPLKINFGDYLDKPTQIIEQSQYLDKAKQFLESKNLLSDVWSLDNGYIQPVTTDPQGIAIPIQNITKAKYVKVNFNYLLDELSIIDKLHRDYPVQLLLNLDGSVRKLTALLPPSEIKSIGTADTTTPQQALEAINNGQGTFSRLNNPEIAYTELKQGDMTSATFNSVELVYVYDYDTGSIQPFYRFQGYGYTKDGDKIEVGVIITALPQDLYQK